MRYSKIFLLAATFAASACASAPKSSDPKATTITAEEIAAANVPTAFDAVDRLHRAWFRDLTAQGDVVVYMNNQLQEGGKEALRQIPANEVYKIEYLRGTAAEMRFGQNAKGGAILVTRK